MDKKLYLRIKWDETREKNNARAGDDGIYDVQITDGCEFTLIGLSNKAVVRQLSDDAVTLDIPGKGDTVIRMNRTASVCFYDGYQVCGDWVDERLTYEITFSDMSISEYEMTLPPLDIEDGVLKVVRSKEKAVVIPEGVVEIGEKAFYYSDIEEVVLPSTLRVIGERAFNCCKRLSRISLPDGLDRIEAYALAWTPIEEVRIPDSVRFIDCYAFSGTPFLEKMLCDKYVVLGGRFLYMYNDHESVAIIPEGVSIICPSAFSQRHTENEYDYYFHTPERVVLPKSLKRIDRYAFHRLSGLKEIDLRDDMEIDEHAFDSSGYSAKFKEFLASRGDTP